MEDTPHKGDPLIVGAVVEVPGTQTAEVTMVHHAVAALTRHTTTAHLSPPIIHMIESIPVPLINTAVVPGAIIVRTTEGHTRM